MTRPAAPAQELRRPAAWQRLVQRIAWSRPGVWCFSRTMHHIDLFFSRLSRGRISVASLVAGIPVVNLTTTGARSGAPRTMPVLALSDGDRFVVIASSWGRKRHPAWYYNIRAHPTVTVATKRASATYVARQAEGEEREMYWRRAADVYRGFLSYERTASNRHIGVFVLEPKRQATSLPPESVIRSPSGEGRGI
jgi:deazaflavin-dependent oxidoreductase (nitroreductase family)